ncbi:MAG: T9SS type A sorting domain-containing protein [Bacteroidales bacterium]
MKRLTFFTILLSISICNAQELLYMGWPQSTISFEDTAEFKYIKTDTSKIWHIMEPNKQILFLPSSDFNKHAIVSDTNRYYKNNIYSSFQFKLIYGYGDFYQISFSHKYDFEKTKDGGIIETSYDNGITWQNLLFDTIIQDNLDFVQNLYSSEDTIMSYNNLPGFTGLQEEFIRTTFVFTANEESRGNTFLLRFTIVTDSVDDQNEGWMLDDFWFGGINVGVVSYDNRERIDFYPNPVKSVLEIKSEDLKITEVKVISLSGKKLMEKSGYDIKTIDMTGIHSGMYLVICKMDNDILRTFKIQKI